MSRLLLLLVIFLSLSFDGRSSHVMGGDITWTCQGGDYVFQLIVYRDCNGADVNTVSELIEVWNHPTVTTITANFVSREDVSPICTEVAGGPLALQCGIGANGGNGVGAIEKITYRSNPITLTGTAPAQGWIFTYDNFSRNGAITNLQDPTLYGLTISAKMYPIPGATGGCVDNSPQFLQDPYFVSCVGDPYEYNMNAVDPDLDSISISFGTPYDHFNGVYDPPNNPAPIPYEPGFSPTSPTPGPAMNPANISAQLDASSGNLTFLSNNTGSYAVKLISQSFRNGVLIAETEREIQLIVLNCAGNNTAPDITGPFGGLFETTINAGDPVNFNLTSTDVELLQDGSPQSNILTASGLMFGTNYTNPAGCAIAPCATLNTTPPITMNQGVTTTFNWQTSCDHVVNVSGNAVDMVPYHFVFKVQDDYCPIPKVKYATVTINVLNPGVIQAPTINCIQTDASDDVTISWNPVSDPTGSFIEYEVYSIQNGLLATLGAIGSNSYTDAGNGTSVNDYYISVVSGCNGNTTRSSDTISNIYLDVINPSNGTAVLQWNDPVTPALLSMNGYYHIYREYPTGTWTLYDSVPYGVHNYIDTIDICSVDLNYQIVLPNIPCDYTSNIDGDNFQDMMTPDIPVISEISIDTLTNQVLINWDVNNHPDTYGYVIYMLDGNGVPVEIDTVWGINNTNYAHTTNTSLGPVSYTVAAFDSCLTTGFPPTYQTSAKAPVHSTAFVSSSLNICEQTVDLSWTSYVGWDQVDAYNVYGYSTGNNWTLMGTTSSNTLTVNVIPDETYCFVVEAVHASGVKSFSNQSCIYIQLPGQPQFNYLKVATVNNEMVDIRYMIDMNANVAEVSLQRKSNGPYEEIVRLPVTAQDLSYVDSNVDVSSQSYKYRVQIIDSCGRPGAYSNIGQTILLRVQNDDIAKLNYIFWNPYQEFDGSVLGYNIYRGIDGQFGGAPIAFVLDGEYSYEDDVNNVISNGSICYRVEALESINTYSFNERSYSNDACAVFTPLIYIPNAFMPDGINKIFKPIVSDFDPTSYEFTVYSRWGQLIFRTNLPDEGWDGTINQSGNMAPTGTYLYVVTLRDANGVEVLKRGHVSLLK